MYTEYHPGAALEQRVECLWTIESRTPVAAYPVRPDGCMDLIYSREQGLEAVGVMTRERRFDLPAGEFRMGLRFQPGMAREFLGIDACELRDRTVPLDAVIGRRCRALRERLDRAASDTERRDLLLDAVARCEAGTDPVRLAIAGLTRSHGETDVDWLARKAGLSTRQFRRRCQTECGVGPKHLARILRFRRACRLATEGESWLRVAAEAGYFDQAHLIRDFREFTGAAPMSVFSKTAGRAIG
jgi:AraC-like DNA-binding protein